MMPKDEPMTQDRLRASLRSLEERISRIEDHLGLQEPPVEESVKPQPPRIANGEDQTERLEIQLGQAWFARVGIVVLALGVVFLLTFPYGQLPPIIPSITGYLIVGGILGLSHYWRNAYQLISRYLHGGGLLLLYFSTLRLAYFSPEPALTSVPVHVMLLLGVVGVGVSAAIRRRSAYLAGIFLFCGYLTALLSQQPYAVFSISVLMSGLAVALMRRLGTTTPLLLAILLANITHLLWALNNPVVGNPPGLVSEPTFNLLFVLIYALIFATGHLNQSKEQAEETGEAVAAFVNGISSYGLFLLLTLTTFNTETFYWHGIASIVYVSLAVLFWTQRRARYATFVYATAGYTAMSVAIVAGGTLPDFFVWLCWQSVLVISTAVWFRSRLIVVGNFVVYILVFIAYLLAAGTLSAVSLSFGVVALVSARILNWKRDRLELKTEGMRYAYLGCALFVIPYALFHTVPAGYVSLSWLAVALLYYLISRLLHNSKYRWMSLLTVIITILYVLFVDMVKAGSTLRIVSFLVLGAALLVISIIYTRKRLHQVPVAQEKNDHGGPPGS